MGFMDMYVQELKSSTPVYGAIVGILVLFVAVLFTCLPVWKNRGQVTYFLGKTLLAAAGFGLLYLSNLGADHYSAYLHAQHTLDWGLNATSICNTSNMTTGFEVYANLAGQTKNIIPHPMTVGFYVLGFAAPAVGLQMYNLRLYYVDEGDIPAVGSTYRGVWEVLFYSWIATVAFGVACE